MIAVDVLNLLIHHRYTIDEIGRQAENMGVKRTEFKIAINYLTSSLTSVVTFDALEYDAQIDAAINVAELALKNATAVWLDDAIRICGQERNRENSVPTASQIPGAVTLNRIVALGLIIGVCKDLFKVINAGTIRPTQEEMLRRLSQAKERMLIVS